MSEKIKALLLKKLPFLITSLVIFLIAFLIPGKVQAQERACNSVPQRYRCSVTSDYCHWSIQCDGYYFDSSSDYQYNACGSSCDVCGEPEGDPPGSNCNWTIVSGLTSEQPGVCDWYCTGSQDPPPTEGPAPIEQPIESDITPFPPPYITCNDVFQPPEDSIDADFHSLRPFQASPCNLNIEDWTLSCGNDVIASDTYTTDPGEATGGTMTLIDESQFTVNSTDEVCFKYIGQNYDGSDVVIDLPLCYTGCREAEDGSGIQCVYEVEGSINTTIDLTESQLPIMGNTEIVPNALSTDDYANPAQRMNEYVSWYLNGAIFRGEEVMIENQITPDLANEDLNREEEMLLTTFSGPLRKLLPWSVQANQRWAQVDSAGGLRHNQVVMCTAFGIPVPCYPNPYTADQIFSSDPENSSYTGGSTAPAPPGGVTIE